VAKRKLFIVPEKGVSRLPPTEKRVLCVSWNRRPAERTYAPCVHDLKKPLFARELYAGRNLASALSTVQKLCMRLFQIRYAGTCSEKLLCEKFSITFAFGSV
jgi:hypothetical protein